MKKTNSLLIAMFLCALGVSASVYGAGLKSSASSTQLGDGGIDDGSKTIAVAADKTATTSSTTKDKVEEKKDDKKEAATGMATLPNGTAYVGVYSYLNLRDGVWGGIQTELYNNQEVTITGRDGDWYKVTVNGQNGYCHARYIFDAKDKRYSGNEVYESDNPNGNTTSGRSSEVVMNVTGDSVQAKVVSAAKNLVNKYSTPSSFPYDPLTNGGSLGCAQVVSTALKAAGIVPNTSLNCTGVRNMLSSAGWSNVKAPPYQAGDVIFWSTYDSSGDGKKDPDTHIGIIMNSGNSVQAMSNSSSQKKPRYHDAEYAPVTRVMRKC